MTIRPDRPPGDAPGLEPEHISDDGLTALCGASLIVDEPPDLPVCLACQAAADVTCSRWTRRRLTACAAAAAGAAAASWLGGVSPADRLWLAVLATAAAAGALVQVRHLRTRRGGGC
jgi:hypothetical protein